MTLWRKLKYLLPSRRRAEERDMREELDSLAAMAKPKELGNITRAVEDARAVWTWFIVEQFFRDARYAVRMMRVHPGFTATAVLSLALGIGANTAIFSFMDAILLRPLPVKDPGSLVVLNWRAKAFGRTLGSKEGAASVVQRINGSINDDLRGGVISGIFPYPAFELIQGKDAVFSSLFGYNPFGPSLNVKIGGQADLGGGEYVSGDYFRGLGVPPAAGRLLTVDDDRVGAPAVAVMSFAYTQKRFGDPMKAVGSTVSINSVSFTVVGVAPPEFFGVDPAATPDVYLPIHASLSLSAANRLLGTPAQTFLDRHYYWVQVMARLRPRVSLAQAQAALVPMFHDWVSDTAVNDKERANLPALVLMPGGAGVGSLRRQYSKPLLLLLTLVGLILAIACANIANLLFSRATARRREMAVRLSIGAGRLRVIRQLLAESVLLASVGGVLGIGLAVWGIRFLTFLLANGRQGFTLHAELNWHVLAVAAGLSILAGVLFGLAPAIQSTRVDVMPALKNDLRPSGGPPASLRLLISAQIAIALLVLVAAGLFIKTLSNLNSIQVGFNRENLLLFQVDARQAGHKDPEIADYYRNLQTQFEAIPGVRKASLSNFSMMLGGVMGFPVKVHGSMTGVLKILDVGPSFFATMQIPILAGHDIEDRGRPIAVVDEEFVKRYMRDENPLGQHIAAPGPDARHDFDDVEIVGVCANAKYGDLRGQVTGQPTAYFLYNRVSFPPLGQMVFELRTAGNPLNYVSPVREIVRRADPGVPVFNIKTQAAEIDERTNQETIFARLSTLFAILALAMTCVGLYGTVSYNAARRTNEIGIRMALGAQRGSVIRMILRDVLAMVFIGLAIGLPVALATSKFVGSFLYGMKPNDPLAITAAVAAMLAAALLAGYVPARRASRIDPMAALRHE